LETEFGQHFDIESKTDVSYNVRSARYLSVERQNKIVAHTLKNYDFLKQLSWCCYSLLPEDLRGRHQSQPEFYNLRPGGIFYQQLDNGERQYLIYVLKPKAQNKQD
jgi:hypothetical protein